MCASLHAPNHVLSRKLRMALLASIGFQLFYNGPIVLLLNIQTLFKVSTNLPFISKAMIWMFLTDFAIMVSAITEHVCIQVPLKTFDSLVPSCLFCKEFFNSHQIISAVRDVFFV